MSAINLTDIPTEINTVERLAAYALLLLARLNPVRSVLEVLGEPEIRAAFSGIGTDSNGNQRLISRVSLQLDPNYASDPQALWLQVEELSDVEIPPQFLAA